MIDKNKEYSLNELLDIYDMYNIDFKYYGNNKNGELELYLKTDTDKVSVFKSISKISKYDYLKLSEKEARNLYFIYDREVNELELDIVAVVLRTSDVNIPAGRYTLKSLDKLTKEQDAEERSKSELSDGIAYIIVDNNTACTLYDDVYLFGKNQDGLIASLEERIKKEKDGLIHDNLKLILNYFNDLIKEILPDTKYVINDIKKNGIKVMTIVMSLISSFFLTTNVYAVEKIEGGNVTIESLGAIIKSLATKVQIFGIVLSFIALVVFVIQFIIGDDETKQRRKKTILYTLGGVALLILVPSIINFVIDILG